MTDYMIRAKVEGLPIRIFAVDSKNTVNAARKIHNLSPVACAAMGRLLSASALMTLMLKNDRDKLTVQINGSGPIGKIIIVGNNKGHVKGEIYNPNILMPLNKIGKLDVAGAIGAGTLTIIKDIGLVYPYCGQVELVSGEIAEDIAYYFAISEQTPSVVALGVLVDKDLKIKASGGYIIQLLPDCDEEIIDFLEQRIKEIPSITELISGGMSPKEVLEYIFEGHILEVLEKKELNYFCDCNRERLEKVLISLGKDELEDIISKDEGIELICHFCNKKYFFNKVEVRKLFE